MDTVRFDPNGGRLTVRVTRGFAVPGTYNLGLYEADEVTAVKKWQGIEFSTPDTNTHQLPDPPSVNDGRVLYLDAFVGLIPPDNSYSVRMVVLQGGAELMPPGGDSGTGTPPTKEVRCTLGLKANPSTAAGNA